MITKSIFVKNTLYNFFFKGINIIINIILVPILLNYLGNEKYGIWQTIFMMLTWVTVLNFGFGNSLRNFIAKARVNKDYLLIEKLLATSIVIVFRYSFLILITFVLLLTFFFEPSFLFNNYTINDNEIKYSILISVSLLIINLPFSLLPSVLYGLQKSHFVTFSQSLPMILLLSSIIIIGKTNFNNKLILISFIYGIGVIISNIIIGFYLNKKENIKIIFMNYDTKRKNELSKLGWGFFLLQLSALILSASDNILISRLIDVKAVTIYSIINKFYYIIITIFSIIMIQFWNSVTASAELGNKKWIIITIKKIKLLIIPTLLLMGMFIFFNEKIIHLWTGKKFIIDQILIILLSVYTIIHIINSIYINVANGLGIIKLTTITYIIAAVIYYPLSYYLIKYMNLNTNGLVIAKIIVIGFISVISFYVFFKEFYAKSND